MHKIFKGFSEKKDGSMYVPLTDAMPENIAHRKAFFEREGLAGKQIAIANMAHGTHVALVDRRSPFVIFETDALVTKDSDIILALTGADCFPVYFEEKTVGIIGLAHCGWRGITTGIIGETLVVIESVGGKKENILLTIGPGICTKHFEIGADILSSFSSYPDCIIRNTGVWVDLKKIIKQQAVENGVSIENIIDTGECTYCLRDKYFSFRRDQPRIVETQIAYIVQYSHQKF